MIAFLNASLQRHVTVKPLALSAFLWASVSLLNPLFEGLGNENTFVDEHNNNSSEKLKQTSLL